MKKQLTTSAWWFMIHNPFLMKGGFRNHKYYYDMYRRVHRMNSEEIQRYHRNRSFYEMMYMLFEMNFVDFEEEYLFLTGEFGDPELDINFKTLDIVCTDRRYPEREFTITEEEKDILMEFYKEYKDIYEYELEEL